VEELKKKKAKTLDPEPSHENPTEKSPIPENEKTTTQKSQISAKDSTVTKKANKKLLSFNPDEEI